jgi:hypothetical protein
VLLTKLAFFCPTENGTTKPGVCGIISFLFCPIFLAPAHLTTDKAQPAEILDFNRHHWSIENKVHWVRDVTFDEDRSRVRKKAGPHVMASLRNLAISMLRMAGADNIAEALRFCSWNGERPLRLIGIAMA